MAGLILFFFFSSHHHKGSIWYSFSYIRDVFFGHQSSLYCNSTSVIWSYETSSNNRDSRRKGWGNKLIRSQPVQEVKSRGQGSPSDDWLSPRKVDIQSSCQDSESNEESKDWEAQCTSKSQHSLFLREVGSPPLTHSWQGLADALGKNRWRSSSDLECAAVKNRPPYTARVR